FAEYCSNLYFSYTEINLIMDSQLQTSGSEPAGSEHMPESKLPSVSPDKQVRTQTPELC
ncbi:hypothetical protein HOY80DRAFT_878668, partial [Tuber brumale]